MGAIALAILTGVWAYITMKNIEPEAMWLVNGIALTLTIVTVIKAVMT